MNAAGGRIVALGGGHGLAAALRAARLVSDDVVGIVSVADDVVDHPADRRRQ